MFFVFFYAKGYTDVNIDCYLVDASSTVFWFLNADLSFSTVLMTGHLHCWERPPVPASCCFRYFTTDSCSCCCKTFPTSELFLQLHLHQAIVLLQISFLFQSPLFYLCE